MSEQENNSSVNPSIEPGNKEKHRKSRRLIITLFILAALLLGIGSYAFYDKVLNEQNVKNENKEDENNNNNNGNSNEEDIENENNNLNPEIRNLLSFNEKTILTDTKPIIQLVAVTKEGKEIVIADVSAYDNMYKYDYYQSKLYLYSYKSGLEEGSPNSTLAYIDLNKGNGNYIVTVITNFTIDGSPNSIAATSDFIYIASSADSVVKKYSLTSNTWEDTNIKAAGTAMMLNSTKDGSNYLTYNIGRDLYVLNTSNQDVKLVDSRTHVSFIYNGKVIYYQYAQDSDRYTYYEYTIKDNTKKALSVELERGIEAIGFEKILPYQNDYLYLSSDKVISYNNGDYKELYDFKKSGLIYGVDVINRVSESDIIFGRSGYVAGDSEEDSEALDSYRTINLESKEVKNSTSDFEYFYTRYYE